MGIRNELRVVLSFGLLRRKTLQQPQDCIYVIDTIGSLGVFSESADQEERPSKNKTLLLFIIPIAVGVLFGLWMMGVFD